MTTEASQREKWYQRLRNWLWGYDFFISYHWASGGTYAVNLAARLREKGYDVFLDRAEYAMGDDWKNVGEIALRNTQRLVLIATREAVFESNPVKREVVLFTDRGRHIIPIFFGNTFATERQLNLADHEVLARLPDSTLYVEDQAENLARQTPPPDIVQKLIAAHGTTKRRRIRQVITTTAIALLTTFSIITTVMWGNAVVARKDAEDQKAFAQDEKGKAEKARDEATESRDISEQRRAELYLQNAQRAIHDHDDVDAGVLWYAMALETKGQRAQPLRYSARNLIGGWGRVLPRKCLVHKGGIRSFKFSPDKTTIATVVHDNMKVVRLWNPVSLDCRGRLRTECDIQQIAFSPHASTHSIAIVCEDALQLWDYTTMARRFPSVPYEGRIIDDIAFCPDGRTLVSAHSDRMVRIWDVAPLRLRYALPHPYEINDFSVSPDGRLIATTTGRGVALGGETHIWEVATGTQKFNEPITHQKAEAQCLEFGPDSRTLLTTHGNEIHRWDIATLASKGVTDTDGCVLIDEICFSADGQRIVTVGDYGVDRSRFEACLWRRKPKGGLVAVRGRLSHKGSVRKVRFSPDSQVLATSGEHGLVHLWDTSNGTLLGKPLRHSGNIRDMAYSPDGRVLATWDSDGTVRFWSVKHGVPIKVPLSQSRSVTRVLFSPDGRTLAIGCRDGTLNLWDTGNSTSLPRGHSDAVTALAFSPSGQALATGSDDGTVQLWNRYTNTALLNSPIRHRRGVTEIAFNQNGQQIGAIAVTGTLLQSFDAKIFSVKNGELLRHPVSRDPWLDDVALCPNGRVVVAGKNGLLRVIDTIEETSKEWDSQSKDVLAVALDERKNRVLTVHRDGQVKLWGLPMAATGHNVQLIYSVAIEGAERAVFSPTCETFAVLCFGDSSSTGVSIRQTNSGRPVGPLCSSDDFPHRVQFSANGKLLAYSFLHYIQFVDVESAHPCGMQYWRNSFINDVSFKPDEPILAVATNNDYVELLDAPAPVTGDPERVWLSVEVATWKTIENGLVRTLTRDEWLERKRDLDKLGGDCLHRTWDDLTAAEKAELHRPADDAIRMPDSQTQPAGVSRGHSFRTLSEPPDSRSGTSDSPATSVTETAQTTPDSVASPSPRPADELPLIWIIAIYAAAIALLATSSARSRLVCRSPETASHQDADHHDSLR